MGEGMMGEGIGREQGTVEEVSSRVSRDRCF
jgi:hypothetical protein